MFTKRVIATVLAGLATIGVSAALVSAKPAEAVHKPGEVVTPVPAPAPAHGGKIK